MSRPNLQNEMQKVLDHAVANGHERGVQLVVYLNGKLVVDAWAGKMVDSDRPVDGDTLFPVFSVTKGITATVAHVLAEKGKLNYDTPLYKLWPGFEKHGKEGLTVRHALAHLCGLWWIPMHIGYRELCDWRTMCNLMADQTPDRGPGVRQDYHAITYGWLAGEAVRASAGAETFSHALREHVTKPLGIEEHMFAGIPDHVEPRVAFLDDQNPNPSPIADDSKPQQIPGWMSPLHEMMNRPDSRRGCFPGSGGIMSARAMAKVYASLLPGGIDGVELLPPERIHIATQRHLPTDMEYGCMQMALGYNLGTDRPEMGKNPRAFGHAGYGGADAFADPDIKLAVGYTHNSFGRPAMSPNIFETLQKLVREN